jgi:hypothetical protein
VAEELHFKKVITTMLCRPPATTKDMDDIVTAFRKVLANKEQLKHPA